MGRKHRSSSLGLAPKPTPASAPASSQTIDLAACTALAGRFVHEKDGDGRTSLHRAVEAASSTSAALQNEDEKLDGLSLLDSLPARMRELDAAGGNKQQPSHLHKLMLASDEESGYTPLHAAILRRDFLTLLVLLKHASSSEARSANTNNNAQLLHPLRLLAGNLSGDSAMGENAYETMNTLAASVDHEGLSPLHLLGRTSSSGLERCRRTLKWKSLRKMWKRHGSSSQQQSEGVNNIGGENPMRRRRMISFGNDQELDYEMEPERGEEWERRGRSGSFIVNLDDGHHDEDVEEQNANGRNNDLVPLEDVNFNALSIDGGGDQQQQQHEQAKPAGKQSQPSENDYGCEVLTFGRADHCALGVPQFASGRIRERGDDTFSTSSSTTSYKPKRVETFALGELRRGWSSDQNRGPSNNARALRERDMVDSPAVAVAASSHHTLVATRSGQLFSFGLGKGGRLGTGDEHHRPLPTRILGPLTKRIVASIAAAENHSLCSTSEGAVYAWGANGFGQLGIMSSSSRDVDVDGGGSISRLSPRRVEGGLKQSFVVAVAAGDRHSVALTKLGEVYCWGDNRSGQLGAYSPTLGAGGSSPASHLSQTNGKCSHQPQRVEGLWSAQPRRRAIAIAAAEFSTLVLTMPPTVVSGASSLVSLPANVVYSWGHGNHSPTRVGFPSSPSNSNASTYSRSTCINPIAIACAKYHNVAITTDGRVYTWGLHSDSLGIEKIPTEQLQRSNSDCWATASASKQRPRSNSQTSSVAISSPQLVMGMLSENGGGKAVAVSASESHTAVVTSDGHLFTWGTSHGNDVMGHKGVRWQPSPRKVTRVHRAVGLAAAREHTALLVGTSFPSLPCHSEITDDGEKLCPLSLQESAAVEIARNVDLFNVIPVALVARRLNCRPLIQFCEDFVTSNLDGVLAVGNKSDFATFLSSTTIVGTTGSNNYDGAFHPFLYHMTNAKVWMEESGKLFEQYAGLLRPRAKKAKKAKKVEHRCAIRREKAMPVGNEVVQTEVAMETNISSSNKRKSGRTLTAEVREEPQLVPQKLFDEAAPESSQSKSPASIEASLSKYHCEVCGISCPDCDSYTLHVNGRKHRNRLNAKAKEEERSVAESMMAMKRMQLMEGNGRASFGSSVALRANPLAATHQTKQKMVWGTPKATSTSKGRSERKPRSTSFQDISNEEQKKSSPMSSPFATKPPSLSSTIASPTFPTLSTPVSSLKMPSAVTSSGSALPLSAFLKKSGGSKQVSMMRDVGASWGAKSAKSDSARRGAKPQPKQPAQSQSKKFSQIQQEEARREKEAAAACRIDGNQWFVQQRERAASIGEIQERERFIEDQRMIEEEIRRTVEEEKKADAKKKQQGRRKQQRRQQKKSKAKRPGGASVSKKDTAGKCTKD